MNDNDRSPVDYDLLGRQLESLMEGCTHALPVLANAAALLWQELPGLNWAGFYLRKDRCLLLGPFQGKPACTVIAFGRGVCGTAAARTETQRVPDVHAFPGHIACDSASNSEIVVPLVAEDGHLLGVMDLDSPLTDRFSGDDQRGLESFARILASADWSGLAL
ncbi:MAG: GAF domain-containing protein [Clostridia bacterium]|nr:GAF domain-containing protein [Clostridia bacterium]